MLGLIIPRLIIIHFARVSQATKARSPSHASATGASLLPPDPSQVERGKPVGIAMEVSQQPIPAADCGPEMRDSPSRESVRHTCRACFRQFGSVENLKDHLAKASHSEHEPTCGCCGKHCKSLESLREHLQGHAGGRLAKKGCAEAFAERGCRLCLAFFSDAEELQSHSITCHSFGVSAKGKDASPEACSSPSSKQIRPSSWRLMEPTSPTSTLEVGMLEHEAVTRPAVAIDCEMVGGGKDGQVDLCARICIVDENETVLLDTYVMPSLPVTDYRVEITGIRPQDLRNAMPFKAARRKVLSILSCKRRQEHHMADIGIGLRPFLVGHDLRHDLHCLLLDYPAGLIRDTAVYPPLLRTNGQSHKLRYLCSTYLGYEIQQVNLHNPKEDAIAAMRLYRRMRNLSHAKPIMQWFVNSDAKEGTDEKSLAKRRPSYTCWCHDHS